MTQVAEKIEKCCPECGDERAVFKEFKMIYPYNVVGIKGQCQNLLCQLKFKILAEFEYERLGD